MRQDTLVAILRSRAQSDPDAEQIVFLNDGEADQVALTYGELDARARAIAAQLQDREATGERALLLYPPGLEYISGFFGTCYASAIAVPAYPPDPARLERTLPRLAAIAADAGARFVLTTSAIRSIAEMLFEQAPGLAELEWIATDEIEPGDAASWRDVPVAPDDLAFLQYTSGSTGSPKGVMLSHRNLLHNLGVIHECFAHSPQSQGFIWLPPYHDMGLIGGILQPIYGGFPVTLMSPLAFLQRPLRWLEGISKWRATTSGGPNFAFDLCVRKVTPADLATLDLSCWSVAFNGAEPVRRETLDNFARTFAPCGFSERAFLPCYGLAEATLIVSGTEHDALPMVRSVQAPTLERNLVTEPRTLCALDIEYRGPGASASALASACMRDIALSGAFVSTPAPPTAAIGEVVHLLLAGAPLDGTAEIRGEVVRMGTDAEGSGFGVRFIIDDPDQRRWLERNVAKIAAAAGGDSAASVKTIVGCGPPRPDVEVVIVQPETMLRCLSNQVGEIWVRSSSVASGYWSEPAETSAALGARLADTGAGPFLRTGDLGFLRDSELFVTGRLKDLLVIRGVNYYPQDIERTVEKAHPSFLRPGCGAAVAVDIDGEERLVVLQEVDRRYKADRRGAGAKSTTEARAPRDRRSADRRRGDPTIQAFAPAAPAMKQPDVETIVGTIRRAIAEQHDLLAHAILLLKPGTIPKTSSGKIQRHVCRTRFLNETLEIVGAGHVRAPEPTVPDVPELSANASAREVETWFASLVAMKLGIARGTLEVRAPLTQYGLDSLLTVELQNEIEERAGVVIPISSLLGGLNISGTAALILEQRGAPDQGLSPGRAQAGPGAAPLSFGQQGLWFLYTLEPDNIAYHIAAAVRIVSDVDPDLLEQTFQALVDHHGALRTTFELRDDGPVQRVHDGTKVSFEAVDAREFDAPQLQHAIDAAANRRFDLETGPLFRAHFYADAPGGAVLLVVVHHAVSDLWSMAVLADHLGAFYAARAAGAEPPAIESAVEYTDFVRWRRRLVEGEEGARLWEYWRGHLAGDLPVLALPTDHPRPPVQTFRGATERFALTGATELGALARRHGATLNMLLLANYAVLLARYSGQDDLVIGSVTSARDRAALANLVGFVANTLPLRIDLSGDPSFADLVGRVRETVLGGLAHQAFPFPYLVERLDPERDPGRSPLFGAAFVFQKAPRLHDRGLTPFALGVPGVRMQLGPLVLESVAIDQPVALFDLTVTMAEAGQGLVGTVQYNTDLFDGTTVSRMLGHFERLLDGALADPAVSVAGLPLLTAGEAAQVTAEWSDTARDWGDPAMLPELLAAQVARTPQAVALVYEDVNLSYATLSARSDRLAADLRAYGVGCGSLIGVCLERSVEMVVALVGVLRAGAAYVPFDPTLPADRLAFMCADAGVSIVLSHPQVLATDAPRAFGGARVLSMADLPPSGDPPDFPASRADSAAYMIYTSGSTGRPKGVLNHHAALNNRLRWMQAAYGLGPGDCVVQKTPFGFDVSVWEFFWTLMQGARLVMAPPEVHKEPRAIAELIAREGVTTIHFVPSMLEEFLRETELLPCDSLRWVVCSGEVLPVELQRRFQAASAAALENLYGPTEAAIDVTRHSCGSSQGGGVPIGRPIDNIRVDIVDRDRQPVGAGVAGEVQLAGVGLARGYLDRPALSADRFAAWDDGRAYRTGDRGKRWPGGTIEFMGRFDHQVKLRGFRIELGDIEAALRTHPCVQETVVVVQELAPGNERLVAYLVPDPSGEVELGGARDGHEAQTILRADARDPLQPSSSRAVIAALPGYLASRLPSYMIPSAFVSVDALARTSSGKIDRKALRAHDPRTELDPQYVAPQSDLQESIAGVWREVLHLDRVGIDDNFFDAGGSSLLVARLHRRLEALAGRRFPMVTVLQHTTVRKQAQVLARADGLTSSEELSALVRVRQRKREQGRGDATGDDAVAIIGLACRFPGARDVEEYWENLCAGRESRIPLTDEQLAAAGADPADMRKPNFVRSGAFVDDVDLFDARFFGYAPADAEIIDPQQRVFLETCWHAMEDAGLDAPRIHGRVGVYAGSSFTVGRYLFRNLLRNRRIAESGRSWEMMLANTPGTLSTRVAYHLDLTGPAVNVQSACSTSLVATALACRAILSGRCDLALAGGVSLLDGRVGYLYEEGFILSPVGRCRPFDASGSGTRPSEGVGVVVLKRLADALRDGDPVQAVIRGNAINNDGSAKLGYTAPSVERQAEVIAESIAVSGVDARTIGYVEAHGTGTELGDPIEVEALTRAFRIFTPDSGFCGLGSVKGNIGHTDAAAGVAGLIKAVLMLRHGAMVPSINFDEPNPKIDFAHGPFFVNTEMRPWPRGATPRRAGVTALGIGGTNAHLTLEEAPIRDFEPSRRGWHLLVMSAKSAGALERGAAALAAHLDSHSDVPLADAAHTLQSGRATFGYRRIAIADSIQAAARSLDEGPAQAFEQRHVDPRSARSSCAMMFPGQGAQRAGMGRELREREPIFAAALDECLRAVDELAPGLQLDALLRADPGDAAAGERLAQTEAAQPAVFAVSYALARLWQAWGIAPDALVGHSLGEYVAATIAGVFTLDDALQVVVARGRLMQTVPRGSMLAVPLSAEELASRLNPNVSMAAVNSPRQCVISGPVAAIAAIAEELSASGVTTTALHTSHAYHSAMMDRILAPFRSVIGKVRLEAPKTPVVSNVTGQWLTPQEATSVDYWVDQIRRPVRFFAAAQTLSENGNRVCLEVGPGSTLTQLVRAAFPRSERWRAVSSLPYGVGPPVPEDAALLRALGQMWLRGCEASFAALYDGESRRRISLPTYAFEPDRHWVDPDPDWQKTARGAGELSRWFHVPLWRQSVRQLVGRSAPDAAPDAAANVSQSYLMLIDECGLGDALCRRLAARGSTVVRAVPGDQFGEIGPGEYRIDPTSAEDYRRLIAVARGDSKTQLNVLHLWGVTRAPGGVDAEQIEDEQRLGYGSLVALAQALERKQTPTLVGAAVRLLVVQTGVSQTRATEVLHPAKSLALGPAAVMSQESDHVTVCHVGVWVDPAGDVVPWRDETIDGLLHELRESDRFSRVAYREGQRWVLHHETVPLDAAPVTHPVLRPGGVYLITGGTGAIGLQLARYLARKVGAKLALVSRSVASDPVPGHGVARTVTAIREIEQLGGEVLVAAADVTDSKAMAAVVARVRDELGPVNGVIHAAGVSHWNMLRDVRPGVAEEVLDAKVRGVLVTHEAVRDQPLDFFLSCSSLAATIGGLAHADYAAANAFLDAYAAFCAGAWPRTHMISVQWGRWDLGGAVERDMPAQLLHLLSQTEGYRSFSVGEGLEAFDRLLQLPVPIVIVKDRLEAAVREAFAPRSERSARPAPRPLDRTDGMPYVEPTTELERRIAGIWATELGVDPGSIGATDNFFELGGTSVSLVRAHKQLRTQLDRDIAVTDLFEHPTVRAVASFLSDEHSQEQLGEDAKNRAQKQLAARQRRGRRKIR